MFYIWHRVCVKFYELKTLSMKFLSLITLLSISLFSFVSPSQMNGFSINGEFIPSTSLLVIQNESSLTSLVVYGGDADISGVSVTGSNATILGFDIYNLQEGSYTYQPSLQDDFSFDASGFLHWNSLLVDQVEQPELTINSGTLHISIHNEEYIFSYELQTSQGSLKGTYTGFADRIVK